MIIIINSICNYDKKLEKNNNKIKSLIRQVIKVFKKKVTWISNRFDRLSHFNFKRFPPSNLFLNKQYFFLIWIFNYIQLAKERERKKERKRERERERERVKNK